MLYLCSSVVLRSECLEPFLSCCVPEREGKGEGRGGGEGKGRLREDLHFLVGLHAGVCFPLTLQQNISHPLITLRTALDTTHLHKS